MAISNVNILPEIGLYNGAIGTVKIVYNNRPVGPNDKEHCHLPDYVVVDFPNLKLLADMPPWDQYHKTVSLKLQPYCYLLNPTLKLFQTIHISFYCIILEMVPIWKKNIQVSMF